jgi:hypothetical protein
MLRLWLGALLVGYLPGALLFRLPVAGRRRRAGLSAEERLFWSVVLSVASSLVAVLALAAVESYRFERLLIANGSLSAAIAVAANRKLLYRGEAARPTAATCLPLVLVALAVWRFFPSSEYDIGGKDPGTYMNEGIQIAQRGSLVIRDGVIAGVPDWASDLFYRPQPDLGNEGLRFMGFWLLDAREGRVVGQFPHLFPASIAIGYGLFGLSGARMTVGAWAALGLLAVYFAGARFVGRAAAFAAAALLALHVIQVWFARSSCRRSCSRRSSRSPARTRTTTASSVRLRARCWGSCCSSGTTRSSRSSRLGRRRCSRGSSIGSRRAPDSCCRSPRRRC